MRTPATGLCFPSRPKLAMFTICISTGKTVSAHDFRSLSPLPHRRRRRLRNRFDFLSSHKSTGGISRQKITGIFCRYNYFNPYIPTRSFSCALQSILSVRRNRPGIPPCKYFRKIPLSNLIAPELYLIFHLMDYS